MVYTEGKHDDPADTQDRLARVGSKYSATAPSVADGDNVYLLVDSAGRPLIAGAGASDAPAVGNPVQVGGVVDDTSPAAAAEADARAFRATPEGNQIVELYKDNNALSPIAAMPGASEVKSLWKISASNSSVRATVVTPTSGKKIRMIAAHLINTTTTLDEISLYFGTGAAISSTPSKAITRAQLDTDHTPNHVVAWPDGAGPVGAVDDVLSMRSGTNLSAGFEVIVHYREE